MMEEEETPGYRGYMSESCFWSPRRIR